MWRLFESGEARFAFITASRELCRRVGEQFARLQTGAGAPPQRTHNTTVAPPSLAAATWPIFVTSRDWLLLVDGASDAPAFPRNADGAPADPQSASPSVEWPLFRDTIWPSLQVAIKNRAAAGGASKAVLTAGAAAVWREIQSHIKGGGGSGSGSGGDGHDTGRPLSRRAYVALPHKAALTFADGEQRCAVCSAHGSVFRRGSDVRSSF